MRALLLRGGHDPDTIRIGDWIDIVWSVVLEEGRGGFMNAHEYRETMTDLFFHGKSPEPKPDTPRTRTKGAKTTPPSRAKVNELLEFQKQLASRRAASEVASPPSE